MPTRIAVGRGRKPRVGGPLDVTSYEIGPPWAGYCPDLNHSLVGLRGFELCWGLMNQDGQLTIDLGWVRLEGDSVSLPLGGDNGNNPEAPAPADHEQPVTLICELSRSDGAAARLNVFAATNVSGNPASSTIGFCWWYNTTTMMWNNVPFAGAGAAIDGERDDTFDWAPYPRGGTPIIGALNPGEIFFTNYYDEVYVWDPGAGAGPAWPPGTYSVAFPGDNFKAMSVELFWERLVFLNTEEGGAPFVKRVRWTDLAATPTLGGAGAGFIDWTEFSGNGLRVLAFQDLCACYFEDGVGILRRSGLSTNPFVREYLSKERGLMGRFSVVRITGDLHFGIFTDGWFYLRSDGVWQEAGVVDTGGGKAHKWSRTFLSLLDTQNKGRIFLNFDEYTRRIQVTFPLAAGGDTTWVYDVDTDTVWPDDPYLAVTWGEASAIFSAGLAWGGPGPPAFGIYARGDTWANVEGRWMDFSAVYGDRATLHGTEDGLIYLHSPLVANRDGTEVSWHLRSHMDYFGDPYKVKATSRLLLEHGITAVDRNVSFGYRNQAGDQSTRTVNFNTGESGAVTTSKSRPVLRGYSIGTVMTGTGAVRIFNQQVTLRATGPADWSAG